MTQITCRELIDFLSSYLAGELPAESQILFERHLSLCPDCVNYLNNLRATIDSARIACENSSQSIPEDLVQAILKSHAADES